MLHKEMLLCGNVDTVDFVVTVGERKAFGQSMGIGYISGKAGSISPSKVKGITISNLYSVGPKQYFKRSPTSAVSITRLDNGKTFSFGSGVTESTSFSVSEMIFESADVGKEIPFKLTLD